jgi:hypothetical protein
MLTVYRDKKRSVVIQEPKFGDTGFIADEGDPEKSNPVIYDKGGSERSPDGVFSESKPGWVTYEEFRRRKSARSKRWKFLAGQRHYRERWCDRIRQQRSGTLGMYQDFDNGKAFA